MAEFLGMAASVGMLALIAALLFTYLIRAGAVKKQTAKSLAVSALTVLGMGTAYFLTAALICHMNRQEISSPALIAQIFPGEKTQRVFAALASPVWTGPLSGLFVYAAHALGALLFGQYALAGLALAYLLTTVSIILVQNRSEALAGEKAGGQIAFLLLFLPGSVFFFLPGWTPMALLLASLLYYFALKKAKGREMAAGLPAYGPVLSLTGVFSAFALTAAVMGWIG